MQLSKKKKIKITYSPLPRGNYHQLLGLCMIF